MKMQPITYFHEPCGYPCEGIREASVVVRVAGAIEQRNSCHLGRRGCHRGRRQHARYCYGEVSCGPTVSKTPRTYVRILSGPGRPLFCPERIGTAWGRLKKLKPTMYGIEESDEDIVALKAANKGRPAELLERMSSPEGKLGEPNTPHTQRWTKCVPTERPATAYYAVMHGGATRGRSRMR